MDRFTAALNAVCPYYTMFPLAFPFGVLSRRSQPRQWVLDPFCGRGTTTFAARLLGLPSVGLDSNPLAAALAAAKLRRLTSSSDCHCAVHPEPTPGSDQRAERWLLALRIQSDDPQTIVSAQRGAVGIL